MARRMPPVVHHGVVEGDRLVPWCPRGYKAYGEGRLVLRTTVPVGVDCSVCKRELARLDKENA